MKIPLTVNSENKTALTFNADDYMKIRKDYRIPGKLIGIPVLYSRNQNINGLPAFFNQYEVELLSRLGVIKLIRKPGFLCPADGTTLAQYQEARRQQLIDQNAEYRRRQVETAQQVLTNQRTGKKSKGRNRKPATNPPDYDAILKNKIEQIQSQEITDPLVQVPTEHPVDVGE